MPASLAIIIPVYRERRSIGACLHHLARCPHIDHCEIVVVDGDAGSTMTPTEILPVSVVTSPAGRGIQLNAGAREASAPALLFLHVDTVLPHDFVRRVLVALKRFPAGAFDLHIVSRNPVTIAIGLAGRLRSRLTRIPYGDQAQFIRRDVFTELGGFPDAPLMEDVALMDAIKARHLPIVLLRPPARTSDRRWRAEGAMRATFRNWRLMTRYRAGISPTALVGRYRPRPVAATKRIIVFYRALQTGAVKTRLAASIGDDAARDVYAAMVADLVFALRPVRDLVVPCIDDPTAGTDLIGGGMPQTGGTLEERMNAAFRNVFADGADRAVLVGSDIPGITTRHLRSALAALRRHDAVIAPSVSGGYYLIGFRHNRFVDIPRENGEDPCDQVISLLTRAGLSVARHIALRDVDTLEDLAAVCSSGNGRHPNLDRAVARHLPGLLARKDIR